MCSVSTSASYLKSLFHRMAYVYSSSYLPTLVIYIMRMSSDRIYMNIDSKCSISELMNISQGY